MPGDAIALRAENGRLRMLLGDKDAQIAALKAPSATPSPETLDATHPSQRLNRARNPSRTATQE